MRVDKRCDVLRQVNAVAAARLMSKKGGAALPAPAADSDDDEPDAEGAADGLPAAKRQRKAAANPLTDDRFASMFRDRDFEIDMESEEYKLLHPNAGVAGTVHLIQAYLVWHPRPVLCATDSHGPGLYTRRLVAQTSRISAWVELSVPEGGSLPLLASFKRVVRIVKRFLGIAEGRAKDKQLLREHFRQLPDVEEDGDASDNDEEDDEAGEDGSGGDPGDDDDDQQVCSAT